MEGSNECWRFTWVGDLDETSDTSIGCDSFFPDDLCFEPIVFTNGSGSGIGPDLSDVTQKCMNVTGNCKCDLSPSEVCVKYTKFLKWAIQSLSLIHLIVKCDISLGMEFLYTLPHSVVQESTTTTLTNMLSPAVATSIGDSRVDLTILTWLGRMWHATLCRLYALRGHTIIAMSQTYNYILYNSVVVSTNNL